MALNKLVALYSYLRAKQLRKQGTYNRKTLKCFLRAWRLDGNQHYLVEYIKYRRDLGKVVSSNLANKLQAIWSQLSAKDQALMTAFLAEVQAKPVLLADDQATLIPAALASKRVEFLSEQQRLMLSVYTEQDHWRAALAKVLQQCASKEGICVVGNAGIMKQSGLGAKIDSAALVVRFNAFQEGEQRLADLGEKCQMWGVTASFKAALNTNIQWLIVIGPELQYRLADWSYFAAFRQHGIPVITIPLQIWRQLVAELQAPPSAGVTVLAFFYSLLGSWSGVSVAGFGALSQMRSSYHYMNTKNKASQRHNWLGEQCLIERWRHEGLRSLHE